MPTPYRNPADEPRDSIPPGYVSADIVVVALGVPLNRIKAARYAVDGPATCLVRLSKGQSRIYVHFEQMREYLATAKDRRRQGCVRGALKKASMRDDLLRRIAEASLPAIDPCEPCQHPAGTPGKIKTLAERAARGLPLWLDGDATYEDETQTAPGAVRREHKKYKPRSIATET